MTERKLIATLPKDERDNALVSDAVRALDEGEEFIVVGLLVWDGKDVRRDRETLEHVETVRMAFERLEAIPASWFTDAPSELTTRARQLLTDAREARSDPGLFGHPVEQPSLRAVED